jgi:hypothetical protein
VEQLLVLVRTTAKIHRERTVRQPGTDLLISTIGPSFPWAKRGLAPPEKPYSHPVVAFATRFHPKGAGHLHHGNAKLGGATGLISKEFP